MKQVVCLVLMILLVSSIVAADFSKRYVNVPRNDYIEIRPTNMEITRIDVFARQSVDLIDISLETTSLTTQDYVIYKAYTFSSSNDDLLADMQISFRIPKSEEIEVAEFIIPTSSGYSSSPALLVLSDSQYNYYTVESRFTNTFAIGEKTVREVTQQESQQTTQETQEQVGAEIPSNERPAAPLPQNESASNLPLYIGGGALLVGVIIILIQVAMRFKPSTKESSTPILTEAEQLQKEVSDLFAQQKTVGQVINALLDERWDLDKINTAIEAVKPGSMQTYTTPPKQPTIEELLPHIAQAATNRQKEIELVEKISACEINLQYQVSEYLSKLKQLNAYITHQRHKGKSKKELREQLHEWPQEVLSQLL